MRRWLRFFCSFRNESFQLLLDSVDCFSIFYTWCEYFGGCAWPDVADLFCMSDSSQRSQPAGSYFDRQSLPSCRASQLQRSYIQYFTFSFILASISICFPLACSRGIWADGQTKCISFQLWSEEDLCSVCILFQWILSSHYSLAWECANMELVQCWLSSWSLGIKIFLHRPTLLSSFCFF